MKQDTVHITITGDASPLLAELRKADAAIRRTAAMQPDPPLAYWRGVRAGLRFSRAMESVRRTLKGGK